MKPVITGAATPIRLLVRLTMPAMVAVAPRGLIRETMDDATGAAAERPDSAMVIHTSAQKGLTVYAAPNTASPAAIPQAIATLRTLDSSRPRPIRKSTKKPPINRSASDAKIHGMVAKPADFRMLICRLSTR